MTALREQLEQVADLNGAGHPVPQPQALWERGHRWRNRRRAGTAALVGAACVALVGVVLAAGQTSTQEDLRPASSPAGLPDRVWQPSPTLPGTDSTGPLGRLALVMSAERHGWWGSSREPVAISAETGEYAFLDLPRWADGFELSPDGRQVAYWLTGAPSGSPPEDGTAITGFAVYDTSSGEARFQEVPTEHTVVEGGLTWADDETLVVTFTQALGGRGDSDMDQGSSSFQPIWVWRLEEAEAAPDVELTERGPTHSVDGGGHGLVWWVTDSGGPGVEVLDPRQPQTPRQAIPLEAAPMMNKALAVDASGSQAAGGDPNRSPSEVHWASVDDGPRGKVPGTKWTFRVLAWVDDSRILVLRSPNGVGGNDSYHPTLMLVDVRSGDTAIVTAPVEGDGLSDSALNLDVSVAWELATEPTFEASEPPDPVDKRLLLAAAVAAVLGVLVGPRWWRRRVQP